jgi:hypothetical protein
MGGNDHAAEDAAVASSVRHSARAGVNFPQSETFCSSLRQQFAEAITMLGGKAETRVNLRLPIG